MLVDDIANGGVGQLGGLTQIIDPSSIEIISIFRRTVIKEGHTQRHGFIRLPLCHFKTAMSANMNKPEPLQRAHDFLCGHQAYAGLHGQFSHGGESRQLIFPIENATCYGLCYGL
jgi:hypothetical protein